MLSSSVSPLKANVNKKLKSEKVQSCREVWAGRTSVLGSVLCAYWGLAEPLSCVPMGHHGEGLLLSLAPWRGPPSEPGTQEGVKSTGNGPCHPHRHSCKASSEGLSPQSLSPLGCPQPPRRAHSRTSPLLPALYAPTPDYTQMTELTPRALGRICSTPALGFCSL